MAITAADIHNQSFSVDRKGYDVDEVDVFLERVADEIDALNAHVAELEQQLSEEQYGGAERPSSANNEANEAALAQKDAVIADLERQLEERRADDNAIAQALIVAQRSGDKIIEDAKAQAASTIQDAEDEAHRILTKAENDKQKVLDAIKKLEDEREVARIQYKDMLTDFVNDATRKLADIEDAAPSKGNKPVKSAHAAPASSNSSNGDKTVKSHAAVQTPVKHEGMGYYATPQPTGTMVAPATPKPSTVEKDFSGFGEADAAFDFEELD